MVPVRWRGMEGVRAAAACLLLAACAAGPVPVVIDDIAQQRWHWVGTLAGGVLVERPDPARYWFEAARPGAVLAQADCNSGVGQRPQADALVFGPLALTRRACEEGSLDARFAAQLGTVRGGSMDAGLLRLLAGDAEMLFVPDASARLVRLDCGALTHDLAVTGSSARLLRPAPAPVLERFATGGTEGYAGGGWRFTRRGADWTAQAGEGGAVERCSEVAARR